QFAGVSGPAPVSRDGKAVAFAGPDVPGDFTTERVYVRTLSGSPTTGVVSEGNGLTGTFTMSDDGRFVAFVAADGDGVKQVYVRDRDDASLEPVSVSTGNASGNGYSGRGLDLSSDGRYVSFTSEADNLVAGDTNGQDDIFVHDRTSGTTRLASVSTAGAQGNGDSSEPQVSDDGRDVAFTSLASNLVKNDTNNTSDVFVRETP
ncbi:MAG: hypothetical protein JO291_13375, partial [Acidimicrobiia bacterium]|nr:hypothetical protein [Acidimicrobiia bacterium]